MRRFLHEARSIASVRHPNVIAVYDVGEADMPYLVLELLEGETLRSRLASGPLRTRTAIDFAAQLARGLAAAHAKNVVHRDLKPENVFVSSDGHVKILDFGLAKLVSPAGHDLSTALPSAQTAPGFVLGTLGYMAPEQVRGLPVDHRADLFALGAVLYELLTGRRAFDGATTADVMTAILERDPRALPAEPGTPRGLARIVNRCLEKNSEARFRSADDLAFALEGLSEGVTGSAASAVAPPASWVRTQGATILASGLLGAALAAGLLQSLRSGPPDDDRPVIRLQLTLPDDVTPVRAQPPAVSPDGLRVAVVGIDNSTARRFVYLRPLDSPSAQMITGTDRATFPFWSSDGRRIAFFADGRLKTVDLGAGAVQDVCAAPAPVGPGIWSGDTIVFPTSAGPLRRVSASGGGVTLAAPFEGSLVSQMAAGFLTDGQRFVFTEGRLGSPPMWLASPDGSRQALAAEGHRGLIDAPWRTTAGATDGRLLFVQDSRLMAVSLAGDSGKMIGEPVTLAQPVYSISAGGALPFSAHANVVAYVGNANVSSRIVWLNRRGEFLGQVGGVTGYLRDVSLAPDGSVVGLSRLSDSGAGYDLMLVDVQRSTTSRIAPGANAVQASWTPDGSAIVFTDAQPSGSQVMRVAPREGSPATVAVERHCPPDRPVDVCRWADASLRTTPARRPGRYLCPLCWSGQCRSAHLGVVS